MSNSEDKMISEEDFYATYKPVPNPFNSNASWDGSMLGTSGRELAHVREVCKTAPNTVWTVLDCDGALVVGSGSHTVNCVGYIITEVPVEPGQSVTTIPDEEEFARDLEDEDGDN